MKIFYFEASDFQSYPLGGTLSFAKQFIENIEAEIWLIGFGSDTEPRGKWTTKIINNRKFNFFSIASVSQVKKSKLPKRLYSYFVLKNYISTLYNFNPELVFTQTPQFVFLLSKYKWNKFCFCFAGLGNSVALSKFKALRVFGKLYEKQLFKSLIKSCHVILAAADQDAINEKSKQYGIENNRIISFPTRFNLNVFFPIDQQYSRNALGFGNESKLIITTGRLSYIKGWRDLIDAFRILIMENNNVILIFVGEGEDKQEMLNYAHKEIKSNQIILMGRKNHAEICLLLNAADLFVMTSFVEGWPTSMVEAIACGKNVVSTNIGGATEMIKNYQNGIIVKERSSENIAIAIKKALNFENPNPISIKISKKYASINLNDDFKKIINDFSN